MVLLPKPAHPMGEPSELSKQVATATLEVDTFEGKIQIEWEPGASVTPMEQLAFFIQFLKTGCRFEPWVDGNCSYFAGKIFPNAFTAQ